MTREEAFAACTADSYDEFYGGKPAPLPAGVAPADRR